MNEYRNALPSGARLDRGKYAVDAPLGEGGFGIVYRARHAELRTWHAIKEYLPLEVAVREGATIHPRSSQSRSDYEDGLNRFVKEAQNLVRFKGHPNIVRCTDFFRDNGTAYLVMAYEEGDTLANLMTLREARGEPLTEPEAVDILIPLLNGLERVHAEDILHRDIKPSNVFIRRADEQPVLLDFGAAKQDFSKHSHSKAPYTDGYAPRELVEDEGQLGPWTDMYAIGALMWRIVAGEHPVKVEKRISALQRGRPDPLALEEINQGGRFSAEFLGLMWICLALDENERIQSAKEARAWLEKSIKKTAKNQARQDDVEISAPYSTQARADSHSDALLPKQIRTKDPLALFSFVMALAPLVAMVAMGIIAQTPNWDQSRELAYALLGVAAVCPGVSILSGIISIHRNLKNNEPRSLVTLAFAGIYIVGLYNLLTLVIFFIGFIATR